MTKDKNLDKQVQLRTVQKMQNKQLGLRSQATKNYPHNLKEMGRLGKEAEIVEQEMREYMIKYKVDVRILEIRR